MKDRQAHINKRIPCVSEVMQNTNPLPSGFINRQDHISTYQSQTRPGSPVSESPQISDQQVAISQDDIKSLADSVRALAVQLSTFTWLDKTIKGMGGSVSTLVDQQKTSQSQMENIEKVISQPSGKIICSEKIVSQHSELDSVIPKLVHPEEVIL